MNDSNNKERFMAQPIEKHDTAAWDNIEKSKVVSQVIIPGEVDVRNAKEWVDSNQK